MSGDLPEVWLSPLDTERFGIRTARVAQVTAEALPAIIRFCSGNGVSLLIARCLTSDIRAAQAMEREGFALMDTLVYYARDLLGTPMPPDLGKVAVRPVRVGEEDDVRAVASEAFRGYYGHYHSDERLDRNKCDEAYTSWATRSCVSREVADEVLVADRDGSIVGFATLKLNGPAQGEGVLFGVAPSAQGQGLYRSFIVRSMEWCLSQGAAQMVVSTQITNIAVQKVWSRLRFDLSHSCYTFHGWFDGA